MTAFHDAVITLCRELIAIRSENPPGSTAAIADHLERRLSHPRIAVKRIEPMRRMTSAPVTR